MQSSDSPRLCSAYSGALGELSPWQLHLLPGLWLPPAQSQPFPGLAQEVSREKAALSSSTGNEPFVFPAGAAGAVPGSAPAGWMPGTALFMALPARAHLCSPFCFLTATAGLSCSHSHSVHSPHSRHFPQSFSNPFLNSHFKGGWFCFPALAAGAGVSWGSSEWERIPKSAFSSPKSCSWILQAQQPGMLWVCGGGRKLARFVQSPHPACSALCCLCPGRFQPCSGKGFFFPFGFISPSWEKVVIFGLPRGPIPQPPVPEPEGEKREPGPSRAACWERGSCGVWGLSRLQGVLSSGRSIPSPDSLPLSACGHPVCQ